MATESMVTTEDNPYDPFTEFDAWYTFDTTAGYHTSAYLARVVVTSNELSEVDQYLAIEQAIDEIIEINLLGIYKKVSREVSDTQET